MDTVMGATTATVTPQDQVDVLLQQVADEHGLEINLQMGTTAGLDALTHPNKEQEELTERLARLRNSSN